MEAVGQNYEVLVEDKRTRGAGPSNRNETQTGPKKNDRGPAGSQEKMKLSGFRLSSDIERRTYGRSLRNESLTTEWSSL